MIRCSDFWPSSSWDQSAEHQERGVFLLFIALFQLEDIVVKNPALKALPGTPTIPAAIGEKTLLPFHFHPRQHRRPDRQHQFCTRARVRYPLRGVQVIVSGPGVEGGFMVGFLTDVVRPPGNAGIKADWKRP